MPPNKFSNLHTLTVKLNAMGKRTQTEVSKAVRRGAQRIADNAATRITNPPKTGRIYKRGKKLHQASAPGEAPARDTGRLSQSITTVMTDNGPDVFRAEVGPNAPYATALELGTSKMEPRPFMGPAFEEEKDKVIEDIKAAVVRGALAK